VSPHLTVEQRWLALRLKARGLTLREIGPQVGCSFQNVALVVRDSSRRPLRRAGWAPGPGRLTLAPNNRGHGRGPIGWAPTPGGRKVTIATAQCVRPVAVRPPWDVRSGKITKAN